MSRPRLTPEEAAARRPPISFIAPTEVRERLAREAAAQRRSVSSMVLVAVEDYLARCDQAAQPEA